MEQQVLGRTGRLVSTVGLGTWQLGADWGEVSDDEAHDVLEASFEAGVNFFDTADVYGDGRSEQAIGAFLKNHPNAGITVATKMGRRVDQIPENYVLKNFREWTDQSRQNLGVDRLDLVQLHCPPPRVYSTDAVFDALDTLVSDNVVAAYGVSVEKASQALAAIERPNVATVQIVLNAFRLKPLEEVLSAASKAGVGIIARVPLASGLLAGMYTKDTVFPENDHRHFNRDGIAFDLGETFSGVPYDVGVEAGARFTELVRDLLGSSLTPAQAAIAWVWQRSGVSTVIPGARNVRQAQANAAAGYAATLGPLFMSGVREIYEEMLKEHVHNKW